MSGAEWDRIKEIFNILRELEEGERAAKLDELCAHDPEVRSEVLALLDADAHDESFLDSRLLDAEGGTPLRDLAEASQAPGEGPGDRIGPYKLLQQIGEGGFGVVYMAEQEKPIRRRVALKVIKPGMDTKQVIARFEAERQALAMLDHPSIAKVFDAGTTGAGRPYFVMELVRGIPITDYCDEQRFGAKERLALFAQVCGAVHHAHEQGIIHRDIKPSNVMVTLHDGTPVPKVIDFGVAKATRQRLTESTLFTQYNQFIGTPEYMAPEQAAYAGLDVDRRSDIYSLGALLYELLTGTTPFEAKKLRRAAQLEVLRILKEEEPPKPSTRVFTLGADSEVAAKHRQVDVEGLAKLLRGDLDWIVMKAIEKDRVRRYGSAAAMAEDIGRYFEQRPIEARPPSWGYRAQKLLRRRRGPFAAAAVVALLVAGDIALMGWQRTRTAAEDGYARALASRNVLTATWEGDCGGPTVPSPDESMLASAYWCDGGMELIDLRTGDARTFAAGEFVWSFAWSPDGERMALGIEDGAVPRLHFLDVKSGEVRRHELMAETGFAPHRWSSDGRWLSGELHDDGGDVSTAILSLDDGRTTILTHGLREGQGRADFSPDGRFVVFSEFDGDSDDLVAMELASGERWTLTEGPRDDGGALWSPDGGTIAFINEDGLWSLRVSAGRPAAEPRLLRADAVVPVAWNAGGFFYEVDNTIARGRKVEVDPDTGRPTGRIEEFALPDPKLPNWQFRWAPPQREAAGADPSPAVERLAAAAWGDGRIHLIEGENVTSVDVGPETLPAKIWWSPDGEDVLFTSSNRAQVDRSSRTVRALDGERGAVRELFPRAEGFGHTHVTPDGQRMVSFQPEGGKPRQKMVVGEVGRVDGVVVARVGENGDFSTQYGQPLFSPDGSQVVFLREFYGRDDDPGSGLWVVGADGSGERRLANAWGIHQPPQWHPSGRMIAYTEEWERDKYRLKVVDVETGETWEVLDLTRMGETRLQDWSPDGCWIGFTEEIGRYELWVDRDLLERN